MSQESKEREKALNALTETLIEHKTRCRIPSEGWHKSKQWDPDDIGSNSPNTKPDEVYAAEMGKYFYMLDAEYTTAQKEKHKVPEYTFANTVLNIFFNAQDLYGLDVAEEKGPALAMQAFGEELAKTSKSLEGAVKSVDMDNMDTFKIKMQGIQLTQAKCEKLAKKMDHLAKTHELGENAAYKAYGEVKDDLKENKQFLKCSTFYQSIQDVLKRNQPLLEEAAQSPNPPKSQQPNKKKTRLQRLTGMLK